MQRRSYPSRVAAARRFHWLEQIFLFARDKLHVDYLFWSYTYHAGTGAFSYDDALAVMRKHPSF